jgi:hypothetical protein
MLAGAGWLTTLARVVRPEVTGKTLLYKRTRTVQYKYVVRG